MFRKNIYRKEKGIASTSNGILIRGVRAFQVTFSAKWIFFPRVFSSFLYFVQARVLKRLWISYVYVLIRVLNRLIHELRIEISNFWIYNNIRWERIFLYYFLYVESIGQVSSIVANCVLEKVKDLISPILISKILKIDKRERERYGRWRNMRVCKVMQIFLKPRMIRTQ